MTAKDTLEQKVNDAIEQRITIVREAFQTIIASFETALEESREPTKDECVAALYSTITVANTAIATLVEIAGGIANVGIALNKLAAKDERDFAAAVKAAAEQIAEQKQKDVTKRNFIGQPRN